MENAKPVISEPEITPIEGIIAIRKIVGRWLHPDGTKPRDAIASVANVLLSVSVPVLTVPLTESQVIAKSLIDSIAAADDFTSKAIVAAPPTHFTGLNSNAKVDIVTHLEKMIEQACHKPGEWTEGPLAAGSIEGRTFTESYDLAIGSLLQRRDAFLAIDAVNALPELIRRIRGAEKGEQAADKEVQRLEILLESAKSAAIDACGAVIATCTEPQAWHDVMAERHRQVSVEWHTDERDDCYTSGELAQAASAYAIHGTTCKPIGKKAGKDCDGAELFPWDPEHWKPSDRRRNLVKAAALLLADIERLDRMEPETTTA